MDQPIKHWRAFCRTWPHAHLVTASARRWPQSCSDSGPTLGRTRRAGKRSPKMLRRVCFESFRRLRGACPALARLPMHVLVGIGRRPACPRNHCSGLEGLSQADVAMGKTFGGAIVVQQWLERQEIATRFHSRQRLVGVIPALCKSVRLVRRSHRLAPWPCLRISAEVVFHSPVGARAIPHSP